MLNTKPIINPIILGTIQEKPMSKNGNIFDIYETSILNGSVFIKSNIAAKTVQTSVHQKTILLSVRYENIPRIVNTIAIGYKNISTGIE